MFVLLTFSKFFKSFEWDGRLKEKKGDFLHV
jgi:hypothetical protein